MGDRVKAFWLGIFIIAGIAITGWLIMFLKPTAGNGELTLTVRFSNIDKVEVGTRVTFAGKPIGEVVKIAEVADPRQSPSDEFGNLYIYELTLKVDSSVQVYSYDEIVFATSGLLGEKSIGIMPKAAPPGAPPPQNVTHEVLYARSTDKLEATLNKLTQVAEHVTDAMEGISSAANEIQIFVSDANKREFINKASLAADALATTMQSANGVFAEIQQGNLVERLGKGIDKVYEVGEQITQGQGTLGRLIYSDTFYLQLSETICKVDTLLSDINNYGLLFQYDKKWQRGRAARINQMREFYSPCSYAEMLPEEYCEE